MKQLVIELEDTKESLTVPKQSVVEPIEQIKPIEQMREYDPFLTPGQIYRAKYKPKNQKDSIVNRIMEIDVVSTELCNIKAGSRIADQLEENNRLSKNARDTFRNILLNGNYKRQDGFIELLNDVNNVKVSTAATLLRGKQSQAKIFKHSRNGREYPLTRKSVNKRNKSTQEQELDAFEKYMKENR